MRFRTVRGVRNKIRLPDDAAVPAALVEGVGYFDERVLVGDGVAGQDAPRAGGDGGARRPVGPVVDLELDQRGALEARRVAEVDQRAGRDARPPGEGLGQGILETGAVGRRALEERPGRAPADGERRRRDRAAEREAQERI